MPLAPLRLSTITVWPSASWSLPATMRAIWSTVGPGGTGTTMVIGLACGQDCCANAGTAARHSAPKAAAIVRMALMSRLPPCGTGRSLMPGEPIVAQLVPQHLAAVALGKVGDDQHLLGCL